MDKIILYDLVNGTQLTKKELLSKAKQLDNDDVEVSIYHDLSELLVQIYRAIYRKENIDLLDIDLSEMEREQLLKSSGCEANEIKDFKKTIDYAHPIPTEGAKFTLFTSGTTGLPKKVIQPYQNLKRNLKISAKHQNDIWALAFNPTHMAGIQVILQSLLNENTLVNVFGLDSSLIPNAIRDYCISHISATPTFYRLLPSVTCCPNVKKVSCGGEKLDSGLLNKLKKLFPNAQVLNIYASTEAGSVLVANDENFQVKPELTEFVAIFENELHLHKSLLGKFSSDAVLRDNIWYPTSDMVELINESPLTVRFALRKNEMINVGGYKVNPQEVEDCLLQHSGVQICKVYGKKNSVLGNILLCDLVWKEKMPFSESQMRLFLESKLQPFKIPRIFQLVNKLNVTTTGKLERKI